MNIIESTVDSLTKDFFGLQPDASPKDIDIKEECKFMRMVFYTYKESPITYMRLMIAVKRIMIVLSDADKNKRSLKKSEIETAKSLYRFACTHFDEFNLIPLYLQTHFPDHFPKRTGPTIITLG